jgi:capsular polysaccharide transport system permease protein
MAELVNITRLRTGSGSETGTAPPTNQEAGGRQLQKPGSAVGVFGFRYFRPVSKGASALAKRLPLFSFLLLVILPTVVAGIYFGFIASSQYSTEIQFGVRSADAQRNDASSIFQGMAAASQIGLQSNIVVQYIKSRAIVDEINRNIDLREMFGKPSIDVFSRLASGAPAEELQSYWRSKAEPYFELTTGIISVRVRAFTPTDARDLGNEIVRLSEKLSDDLSRRARADYVKFAREQVNETAGRLGKIRQALLEFRDRQLTLDPMKEADADRADIAKLREELGRVRTDLMTARTQLGEKSPVIIALRDRVGALEAQIKDAEIKLFGSGGNSPNLVAQNFRGFEALESERLITEKFYEVALESLQRAEFEATRQATYLEVFVHPALAEQPLYPRRMISILLVFLAASGIWLFLLMTYHSIREHI